MTLGLHFFCGTFALRMVITLQLRFVFAHHRDVFLLRQNYVINLLDVVTVFYNIRITLYFGAFELRTEITLQLRFVFVQHCGVFFITSQSQLFICSKYLRFLMAFELRYILVSSNYVWKLRYKMVIL